MSDEKPAPRGSLWKWWVCVLLLLATTINYMDRQTVAQVAPRLMAEMRLDARDYGQLESAFAFAFAVGAVVFGWLADRVSVRWLYPAAVVAWSAAGFATGLATTFLGLLVCRFLLGLAEGGNWPCALRTTQRVLPPEERSFGNAILQCGAALGAIVTPLIVAWLVLEARPQDSAEWVAASVFRVAGATDFVSAAAALTPPYRFDAWRLPFLVIGAGGIGWVVFWWVSLRRDDLSMVARPGPSPIRLVGLLLTLFCFDVALQIFQVKNPWATLGVKFAIGLIGITAAARWLLRTTGGDADGEPLPRRDFVRRFFVLLVVVVSINVPWHFFRAWLPQFLVNERGFREVSMSYFLAAYYLATDIGSLAAGYAALWLARGGMAVHASRVWVFAACAALTCLSVLAARADDVRLLVGLLLVVGFASLGLFPNYYSFSQSLTTRHQGKLTGAISCINWLAMYLLQASAGELVKATGSYTTGVAVMGLVPLAGVAALLAFWEK